MKKIFLFLTIILLVIFFTIKHEYDQETTRGDTSEGSYHGMIETSKIFTDAIIDLTKEKGRVQHTIKNVMCNEVIKYKDGAPKCIIENFVKITDEFKKGTKIVFSFNFGRINKEKKYIAIGHEIRGDISIYKICEDQNIQSNKYHNCFN